MGRYLLSPKIFKHLKNLKRGAGGEYQLTDAIASLLYVYLFTRRYTRASASTAA